MATTFDRDAAADRLEELLFGDSRVFCEDGSVGLGGEWAETFDDYDDFVRFCSDNGHDEDVVKSVLVRDYLFDVVIRNSPGVSEERLSHFLEEWEVAAIMGAGYRAAEAAASQSRDSLPPSLARAGDGA